MRLIITNSALRASLAIYQGPYDSTTATATWVIFTSGRVLRISRFLRRRFPFTRGRQQALFDVVGKRGAILLTMAKESR